MLQPQPVKFKYLQKESLLAVVKNSQGSKMFQTFLVSKDARQFDVLKKGRLSCAWYVSAVLLMFGLIKKTHFTVARTVEDLLASGAKKVSLAQLQPGDVLLWVADETKTGLHDHVGFYLGRNQAVSNSGKTGKIVRHHYTYKGTRAIELALRPKY